MDNGNDLVYFVNSQGKKAVLSSPANRNYWELRGRTGFTAPKLDLFYERFASGKTVYFGKALQPRNPTMKMVCVGRDSAERDRLFFEMVDTLMDVNENDEGRLYLKRYDGTLVYLNCVYASGLDVTEQYKKLHMFTLEFFAADPLYYQAADPTKTYLGV